LDAKSIFKPTVDNVKYWRKQYSNYTKLLSTWKKEVGNLFKDLNAIVAVDCYTEDYISFHISPLNKDDVEELRALRLFCIRHCGVMEKHFSEYSGTFYWSPKEKCRIKLILQSANALSPNCRIESFKEEITRYKAICE
jgi:hypothetical protein